MAAITKTNGWLNLQRDGQSGANTQKITYCAIGTSNASPLPGDTRLGNEVFRKAVTSYTNGATGEILVNMYLAPNDAVGVVIAEVGFFGGSTASSAANSGVLVARGLYSHTKTNLESIQFQLDATTS